MWLHFVLPTKKQYLCSLFSIANSSHDLVAVRHFRSRPVVFWPQLFQHSLRLFGVIRSIIILLMQNQPDLKTWI